MGVGGGGRRWVVGGGERGGAGTVGAGVAAVPLPAVVAGTNRKAVISMLLSSKKSSC